MNISDFYSGLSFDSYKYLGAHCDSNGTFFRTYAPCASGVTVIVDFSDWQEIPMKPVHDGNFYELFCSDARNGMRYKYRIYDKDGNFAEHIDPFGYSCDLSDCKCSVISSHSYSFTDEKWLEKIALADAMKVLNEREYLIITMRFFKNKTQMEIAERIGISQAQVSRLEKSALERMRKQF